MRVFKAMLIAFLVVPCSILLAAPAGAATPPDQWTSEYAGGANTSTNSGEQLITSSTAPQLTQAWQFSNGATFVAPAIVNGVVYHVANAGNALVPAQFIALSARTGAQLWSTSLPTDVWYYRGQTIVGNIALLPFEGLHTTRRHRGGRPDHPRGAVVPLTSAFDHRSQRQRRHRRSDRRGLRPGVPRRRQQRPLRLRHQHRCPAVAARSAGWGARHRRRRGPAVHGRVCQLPGPGAGGLRRCHRKAAVDVTVPVRHAGGGRQLRRRPDGSGRCGRCGGRLWSGELPPDLVGRHHRCQSAIHSDRRC